MFHGKEYRREKAIRSFRQEEIQTARIELAKEFLWVNYHKDREENKDLWDGIQRGLYEGLIRLKVDVGTLLTWFAWTEFSCFSELAEKFDEAEFPGL